MTEQNAPKKDLTDKQIQDMREVEIKINFRALAQAYANTFYHWPINGYQSLARKIDEAAKKGMTGKAALFTMPVSLVARNAAGVAHKTVEGEYGFSRGLTGTLAAAAGGYVAFQAAFAALSGVTAIAGTVGSIGAGIAAAVVTAPVLLPAFTLGALLAGTVYGAGAGLFTVLTAVPANIKTAWNRSKYSIKGIKYDEDAIRSKLDEDSVSSEYERRNLYTAQNAVSRLPAEGKKKIYAELKQEFDAAAAATAEAAAAPVAENAASAPARRSGIVKN